MESKLEYFTCIYILTNVLIFLYYKSPSIQKVLVTSTMNYILALFEFSRIICILSLVIICAVDILFGSFDSLVKKVAIILYILNLVYYIIKACVNMFKRKLQQIFNIYFIGCIIMNCEIIHLVPSYFYLIYCIWCVLTLKD
jgi:hypothetical protein